VRPSAHALAIVAGLTGFAAAEDIVSFQIGPESVDIAVGNAPFARYVYRDHEILRPYFADVRALDGTPVTRAHPPRQGIDATDHATMHPGIWLAFGDISGADFWRNKGRVEHAGFVGDAESGPDYGRFAAKNRYVEGERAICEEICVVSICVREGGVYLLLDSTFTGEGGFAFGDQEEMGLGVRVATPLSQTNGGTIRNSDGLLNEQGCWGKQADWAEYSGEIDGQRVAVVLMPDPRNFRRSWFHARDYGLLVANPFGRNAFTGGEPGRVEVKAGEQFRIAFGVCIYTGEPAADKAYATYLELVRGGEWTRD
jgi:hypothetical protein